jgi:methionyl-tRNA formyltransferase
MVMRMEEGLDTGPVLMAERTPVGRKTTGELHDELSRLGADLMVRAMSALERGSVTERPQPAEGVTYAKKILKDEARIDWAKSANEIDCLIRGLSPSPGAWTMANGERLKILYAELAEGHGASGEILDDRLTIACGDGALRLARLQRAGKSVMTADELLRGFALPRGTILG